LENRVHDALWNAKVVLEKYKKKYHPNNEAFEETTLKANLFVHQCDPFAHRQNRQKLVDWWATANGIAKLARMKCHLIPPPDMARMIPQDGKIK